ncbi:mechanosensitive ion channel family protein [Diaphorobacter ruginosibacter]|uniref:Small-conductance mechanosensitive channel n=1 Tax=Diaphorobacter ruginosibacter TaxID=1715720 RepID=A0A7G9RVR8_9BURK|nr:mechanosensitive ion channel family protein [Diaphorobacter ruginosibacter]QNN59693.1 mechanosensitive ion channel family protein [Diaphorobacter ruginosibacter]
MLRWKSHLPVWIQDWLDLLIPGFQIVLIIIVAMLLNRMFKRLLRRAGDHYQFPHELTMPVTVVVRWLIVLGAMLMVLERLGVSASVLWTAFTGFATVGAVAFFAAWSVLSNLFCAFLIFTVGPFRVGDHIEVLDTAEKLGAVGKVVDINLLYTTLEDSTAPTPGTLLQIPNALIFQRVVRRWPEGKPLPASKTHSPPAVTAETPAAPKPATFP